LEKGQAIPLELSHFSCERNKQSTIKFNIDLEVAFIYRLIPRKSGFRWVHWRFWYHSNHSLLGASFDFHGGIRHKSVCFWVSVGRYVLYRGACKIWRWVVYLGLRKKEIF
jgi:hypothetical protein